GLARGRFQRTRDGGSGIPGHFDRCAGLISTTGARAVRNGRDHPARERRNAGHAGSVGTATMRGSALLATSPAAFGAVSPGDFIALAPILCLAATAVVLMLLAAFRRSHVLAATVSVVGLVLSLAALPLARSVSPHRITALLVLDGFALFYIALICA